MAIVAGFGVYRAQITFDALNRETGEVQPGRLPATPEGVRGWARRFSGDKLDVAVEAGTGSAERELRQTVPDAAAAPDL
jgi:hypothetical protein